MARKQESEKFTGMVGTTTLMALGFDPSNPLANTKAFNALVGADAAVNPLVATLAQPTISSTPSFPNEVVWSRIETSGKGGLVYSIVRPQFHFDFTSPVEYGDGRLHNVGKIKQAKVVLNVKSVVAIGPSTPTTGIRFVLMCTKQQPSISTVTGKGGATKTTYTLPRAVQGFAIGGTQLSPNNLGSKLNIASSYNDLSTSSTGQIGFNLHPSMLRELENAMRRKIYFSVSVIEQRAYKGTIGARQFNAKAGGGQTVTFYGAGSGNTSLHPILEFEYDIESSKLHNGAGTSRISKAGFMSKHTIAGTSSGFGEF